MMAEWDTAVSLGGLPRGADLRTDLDMPIVYLNGMENKIASKQFTLRLVNIKSVRRADRAKGEHMKTTILENGYWPTIHQITAEDKAVMAAMRTVIEPNKGRLQGTAARVTYDAIMRRVLAPDGITFTADTVGGISGWWCRPEGARSGEVILHLHGGWFNWGSAQAFRNMVGHIAARTAVEAFLPDYRLAPEHPFPAATEDARACYQGLITGDSAGGNLALGLLSFATAQKASGGVLPVAAVVLSPVTDLMLTGGSWETRAAADPYFIRSQAAELVRSYLGGHAPTDPLASPLYGDLAELPPIRIHVGEDEVLLDDSLRYVERAVENGVDARVDVWQGMAHGFLAAIGKMSASNQALDEIAVFLVDRLTASTK
jgi:acetyl esterase/lipase